MALRLFSTVFAGAILLGAFSVALPASAEEPSWPSSVVETTTSTTSGEGEGPSSTSTPAASIPAASTTSESTSLPPTDSQPIASPAASPLAGPFSLPQNVNSKVLSASIQLQDKSGQDLSTLSTVSLDTELNIHIDLLVDEDIHENDYLEFTLPSAIVLGSTGQLAVQDTGGDTLAHVDLTAGSGSITLTFTDKIEGTWDTHIYLLLSAGFNAGELADGGSSAIEFEFGGVTVTVTVNIEEAELRIEKTLYEQRQQAGVYYQIWRLVINTEGKPIQNAEVLDTLPEGTAYAHHRFDGYADDTLPDNWALTQQGGTVLFTHSALLEEAVTLYLVTRVTDLSALSLLRDASGNPQTLYMVNHATLNANDKNGIPLPEANAEAETHLSADWVLKNGAFKIADRAIHWQLDIDQAAHTLPGARVVDEIPAGLSVQEQSITATIGGDPARPASFTYTLTPGQNGGTTLTLSLGDISEHIVVTYSTAITLENFFDAQSEAQFTNTVHLEWSANGPGFSSPQVTDTVKATNKWLEKSGGYWWPRRLYNEWFVTVNENKYDLAEAVTIVDELPLISSNGFYQVFNENRVNQYNGKDWLRVTAEGQDGTQQLLTPGSDYTYAISNGGRTLTLEFPAGTLDGRSAVIYMESELPDDAPLSAIISNTQAGTYTNRVSMYLGGSTTPIATDTHGQWTSRRISEKASTGYDAATGLSTWRLEANPYQHEGFGSLTLRDVLPQFMEFYDLEVYHSGIRYSTSGQNNYLAPGGYSDDASTYTLTEENKLPATEYSYSLNAAGTELTVLFPEETIDGNSYVLILRTKVSDAFYAETRGSTTFINTVYTSVGKLSGEWEASATQSTRLTSTPAAKSVTHNRAEGTFSWEVLINGDALAVDLEGLTVEDALQEGLALDIETVRLEQFSRAANGTLTSTGEVAFSRNSCISYDRASNLFTFTFPALPEGFAYKLYFDTDILQSGTYSNTITLKGFLNGEAEGSSPPATVTVADHEAGAVTNRKSAITLIKTDDSGSPLEGALFELRNEAGDTLETATSGEGGRIEFQTLLKHETAYSLHEVEAPRGYTAMAAPIPVYIRRDASGNAVPGDLVYTATNTRILVPVTLTKVSDTNDPLAGAEFSLTPFTWADDGQGGRTPVPGLPYGTVYRSEAGGTIDLGLLPYGLYALQEQKAPDGYEASAALFVIEVTHPNTAEDGDHRVLYYDVVEEADGSYTYTGRDPASGEALTQLVNAPYRYLLSIYKVCRETGRPLSGTSFEVYAYDAEAQTTGSKVLLAGADANGWYTTDESGRADLWLPAGHYLVREVKAPYGYELHGTDDQIIHIEGTAPPSGSAPMAPVEYQLTFRNPRITADVVLQKNGGGGTTPLQGAKFNLYQLEYDEHGELVIPTLADIKEVLVTGQDGLLSLTLPEGTYALQEAVAPAGHLRSLDILMVELTVNSSGLSLDARYYLLPGGLANWGDTSDLPNLEITHLIPTDGSYYTLVNEEYIPTYSITIHKRDEDDPDKPLAGAVFEITDANGTQITDGADANGLYTTGPDGSFTLQLPAGTYTLTEVAAPYGYTLATPTPITIIAGGGNQSFTVANKQQTVSLSFTKIESIQNIVLPNAIFNLYGFAATLENGEPVYNEAVDPWLIETITSSSPLGLLSLSPLAPGWYALQEVAAPEDYTRSLDIIAIHVFTGTGGAIEYQLYDVPGGLENLANHTLRNNADTSIPNTPATTPQGTLTIVKKDDEGNTLSGIVFGLFTDAALQIPYPDANGAPATLTTNRLGYATAELPEGAYYLAEQNVPEGYTATGPHRVEVTSGKTAYIEVINTKVTSTDAITFTKVNEKGEGLPGATFTLYRVYAVYENGVPQPDTARGEYIEYLRALTSTAGGSISLGHLPVGFYALQEATAPEGYERDADALIGIEVKPDGTVAYYSLDRADHTNITLLPSYDRVITNQPLRWPLRVAKQDEADLYPLQGAVFTIWQGRTKIITPEADANGQYTTDATGEFNTTLPAGTYVLREEAAPYGYTAGAAQSFTITAGGQQLVVEFTNTPITTDITVTKVDEKGYPLPGAEFALYALSVENLVYQSDTFLRTVTSGAGGNVELTGLTYGWYALQETIAPAGYARNLDVLAIHIEEGAGGSPAITLYDVFGGKANATTFYERTVAPGESILMRNEAMDIPTQTLRIRKTNTLGGDTTLLEGASFRVSQQVGNGYVQITDGAGSDGLFTTNLMGTVDIALPNGTYLVEEVTAPAGYAPGTTHHLLTITDGGTTIDTVDTQTNAALSTESTTSSPILLDVENAALGSVTITKVSTRGEALTGAAFNLYRRVQTGTGSYTYQLLGSHTVETTSGLTINGLRPGEYRLVETTAPAGYARSATPTDFSITASNRYTASVAVTNQPLTLNVELEKTDSAGGDLLPGAVFALEALTENGWQLAGEYTTGDGGSLRLSGLAAGEYRLTEQQAPTGYTIGSNPETEFSVEVDATSGSLYLLRGGERAQSLWLTVPNSRLSTAITLQKVSSNGGALLPGAGFDLYRLNDQNEWQHVTAATTGNTGEATLQNLTAGSYKLVETQPPTGHTLRDTGETLFTLRVNTATNTLELLREGSTQPESAFVLVIENDPVSQPPVAPSATPSSSPSGSSSITAPSGSSGGRSSTTTLSSTEGPGSQSSPGSGSPAANTGDTATPAAALAGLMALCLLALCLFLKRKQTGR